MPIRLKLVAISLGLFIFLVILELVRRKKLKEEYSWLWLLTGAIIVILTIWDDLLEKAASFMGIAVPTSTLFLLAFIFLILVCLQFSISISKLSDRIKNLAQELTILKSTIENNDQEKI